MPFSNTSIIEITTFGRSTTGQSILNVFHYRQVTTDPQTYENDDLAEAVNDFAGFWRSRILPFLNSLTKVEKWRGRALTGTIANPSPPPPTQLVVGEQVEKLGEPTDLGGVVGEEMVTFSAFGAQKLSSRAGRNFRGSARFGTISEVDVSGNTVPALTLATVQTNTDLFFKDKLTIFFGPIEWEMCIFSRTLALAAPPPFTDLRALTAIVLGSKVNPFVTSQVSRKQSTTSLT